MSFQIIYTDKGLEKLVLAENGTPLVLEKFAVGDGENTPETSQIGLQNEKWRGYINKVEVSSTTPTNLLITCVVPSQIPETEAFYIRELGLFDTEEELIAIAKVPDSYYAQSSNGIASEKLYNIVLSISNTAEVTLELDTTILATQESLKELEDTVAGLEQSLTSLNNNFKNSLKTQIGKIIINMDNSKRDLRHWDDGVFEYILCDGGPIDTEKHSELVIIYGDNLPNFQSATVRHIPAGDTRTLGSYQEDALQNIKGIVSLASAENGTSLFGVWTASGAFSGDSPYGSGPVPAVGSNHTEARELSFDASRVVRTSSETRMQNIAVQFYVIAKVLI